jgi:type IV/VI secretion system ImpK/VasF family protein
VKNPLWSAIYDALKEFDELLSRADRFGAGGAVAASAPKAEEAAPSGEGPRRKAAMFKAYVATDDLVEVRAKLRQKLDLLRASLSPLLTERETFHVLFALVVLFDERVQSRFLSGASGGSWPLLQTELFKIDDGGEAFYATVDDLVRKPDTHAFVYEVFHYCLSIGFRGRYAEDQAKVNEYKAKLASKIALPTVPPAANAASARAAVPTFRIPATPYAVAAVVFAAIWVALKLIALRGGHA